jgi:hypothetical protein
LEEVLELLPLLLLLPKLHKKKNPRKVLMPKVKKKRKSLNL